MRRPRGTLGPLPALMFALLLAACAQGTDPTDEPTGSEPTTTSSAAAGPAGDASAACEEAFAPLADAEIGSTSDLGGFQAEVEATVESCESVADWMAGAQTVVDGEVRPGGADLLLRIRCESPNLSDAPICEELGP
jgi:hypothetical protein